MSTPNTDKQFAGAIPRLYETYLVPLIFDFYATDLVARLKSRQSTRLLEIAAGTGVVTRAMAKDLPSSVSIVATDLNQAMLDHASGIDIARAVEWRQADAMQLPFGDAQFDTVVCQFGAMFFPDKAKAYSEVRRVLKPQGLFLFNVWDRVEENEFADVATQALATVFPHDPPRFMARTPHGYYDQQQISRDLRNAGFKSTINIDTVTGRSRADSAGIVAMAYCQGTPLRNEIETRDASKLVEATRVTEAALTKRFGSGVVDGKIQAHVVSVERE
jgi:ubiquinone/menaquinone biosynthesis C-methylase UbiE